MGLELILNMNSPLLPSYWGFSDLGHGVSLHSWSSKVQPPFLTLGRGYLLSTTCRSSTAEQKDIYFCFIDYAKAFDCVDHRKLWKILKEMGIPDHLTCLMRNLKSRSSS